MGIYIRLSLLALSVCVVSVAGCAHKGNVRSGSSVSDSRNASRGSKWQVVKKEFTDVMGKVQYFFSNDIPHFFNKEIPDDTSGAKSFVKKEVKIAEKEKYDIENDIEAEIKVIKFQDSCECVHYECGCCQHVVEPVIHLNSTICANASYLDQDIGISVTVTVDGYAIFNETVSVRNPPPVCLGVPYVKEWASACVRFYDIDASRTHLHACVDMEARMKHILIAKYELGCFDIGPMKLKTSTALEHQSANEEPSVMLV